jgi:hypothetical protein
MRGLSRVTLTLLIAVVLPGCGFFMGPCEDKRKLRDFWGACTVCEASRCPAGQSPSGENCDCKPSSPAGRNPAPVTTPPRDDLGASVRLYIPMGFAKNHPCSFAQEIYLENLNSFPVQVQLSSGKSVTAPANTKDKELFIGFTHEAPSCNSLNISITSRARVRS